MDRDSRITAKTYLAANCIEALARWFCDAYPRDYSKPDAENTQWHDYRDPDRHAVGAASV